LFFFFFFSRFFVFICFIFSTPPATQGQPRAKPPPPPRRCRALDGHKLRPSKHRGPWPIDLFSSLALNANYQASLSISSSSCLGGRLRESTRGPRRPWRPLAWLPQAKSLKKTATRRSGPRVYFMFSQSFLTRTHTGPSIELYDQLAKPQRQTIKNGGPVAALAGPGKANHSWTIRSPRHATPAICV